MNQKRYNPRSEYNPESGFFEAWFEEDPNGIVVDVDVPPTPDYSAYPREWLAMTDAEFDKLDLTMQKACARIDRMILKRVREFLDDPLRPAVYTAARQVWDSDVIFVEEAFAQ